MSDYSMSDPQPSSELPLEAQLEALLFVAPGAVTPAQLAEALGVPQATVLRGLQALEAACQTRGIRLQWHRKRVQLTTAPELAAQVERFLGLEASSSLSRAALETLAIIAYKQPITRPQIDAIRGVNSDGVLKNLLSKGLIEELGRADGPGRPILYGTTADFLSQFGLASLDELPPLNLDALPGGQDDPKVLKE